MTNKYLSLDLGNSKTGVAISENGFIAKPFKTLKYVSDEQLLNDVLDIVHNEKITVLVVGFPKNMNNTVGPQGLKAQNFVNSVKEKSSIEVVLWDERLTTISALKILSNKKNKRTTQKKQKDEVAASIILQNYLDSLERN